MMLDIRVCVCVCNIRTGMLHSNPGDYAWGQGGLDAVITQVHYKSGSMFLQTG